MKFLYSVILTIFTCVTMSAQILATASKEDVQVHNFPQVKGETDYTLMSQNSTEWRVGDEHFEIEPKTFLQGKVQSGDVAFFVPFISRGCFVLIIITDSKGKQISKKAYGFSSTTPETIFFPSGGKVVAMYSEITDRTNFVFEP